MTNVNLRSFLLNEICIRRFERCWFHSFIVLFFSRSIFIFHLLYNVWMKCLIKVVTMKLFVLNQIGWFSVSSVFFWIVSYVHSVSICKIRIFVFKHLLRGQVHLLLLVCKSMAWNFYGSHVLNLVVFVNCELWLRNVDVSRMNLKRFRILDLIWIVN